VTPCLPLAWIRAGRLIFLLIGEYRTKLALGDSAAGRLNDRMFAARDRANRRRSEHVKSNDPDRMKNAKARLAIEKAVRD